MKKIIDGLINNAIEGVDTYFHNGSIWLIFTERKQWVIELTENGSLWYNYDFFKNLFNYASLGVIVNQHYITMWVEDTLQNGVKDTGCHGNELFFKVEDTLQNGVKDTKVYKYTLSGFVEDAIQNGVKDIKYSLFSFSDEVEDTIQNGVRGMQTGHKL
jgi:hypothetical protein